MVEILVYGAVAALGWAAVKVADRMMEGDDDE